MNLTQVKKAARGLSLEQLKKLNEWTREQIRRSKITVSKKASTVKNVIEELSLENKTYRLEAIRCGKEKCKCARGQMHGPYWYSYARVDGKLKSTYVGKKLPRNIERNLRKGKTRQGRRRCSG
jgi:hypothetical protein